MEFALVLVTGEELFLLGVKQAHDVSLKKPRGGVSLQEQRSAEAHGPRLRLTPLRTSSLWSLKDMNRLIFQLVLQFTEFTCRGRHRHAQHRQRAAAAVWGGASHLLAARMVGQLVVGSVKRLASIHGVQDDFISHDHLKGTGAQDAAIPQVSLLC